MGREDKRRQTVKDWADIAQAVVTVAAIVIGGIWFLRQGESRAHANVQHDVTWRQLDSDRTWVRLGVQIENAGAVPIAVRKAKARIDQILPLYEPLASTAELVPRGKTRVPWRRSGEPVVAADELWIEPGETDLVEFEFVVPSTVATIRAYSYLPNPDTGKGWKTVTFHDIGGRDDTSK